MKDQRKALPEGYVLTVHNAVQGKSEYIIEKEIGRGSTGIVYSGFYYANTGDRRKVRIKECYPFAAGVKRDEEGKIVCSDPAVLAKAEEGFQHDFHVLSELYEKEALQDSLIDALDLYEANGTVYLISIYGACRTLKEEKIGSLQQCLQLVRHTAYAIAQLHEAGYLYLDLKPENVLVFHGQSDHIRLFDFDSLVPFPLDDDHTRLAYTEGYAPVELKMGQRRRITMATDTYEIGALLYDLLFGRTPGLEACGTEAVYDFEYMVYDCRQYADRLFSELTSFFHHTLAPYYGDRYDSMRSVLKELDQMIALAAAQRIFLYSSSILPEEVWVPRREETQVSAWLQADTPCLYVYGPAGMGRTALIRHVIHQHRHEIDNVWYLKEEGSICHTIADDFHACLHGVAKDETESEAEYYRRKLKALRRIRLEESVLIVIDDALKIDADELQALLDTGVRLILIGSQERKDGLYVGPLGKEESRQLFQVKGGGESERIPAACHGCALLIALSADILKDGLMNEEEILRCLSGADPAGRFYDVLFPLKEEEKQKLAPIAEGWTAPVPVRLIMALCGLDLSAMQAYGDRGLLQIRDGCISMAASVRRWLTAFPYEKERVYASLAAALSRMDAAELHNIPFCLSAADHGQEEGRYRESLMEGAVHFALQKGQSKALTRLRYETILHLSRREEDLLLQLCRLYLQGEDEAERRMMVLDLAVDICGSKGMHEDARALLVQEQKQQTGHDPYVKALEAYAWIGYYENRLDGDYHGYSHTDRQYLHQAEKILAEGIRHAEKCTDPKGKKLLAVLLYTQAMGMIRYDQFADLHTLSRQLRCHRSRRDIRRGDEAIAVWKKDSDILTVNSALCHAWHATVYGNPEEAEKRIDEVMRLSGVTHLSGLDTIQTFHIPCADMYDTIGLSAKAREILQKALAICADYPDTEVYQRQQQELLACLRDVKDGTMSTEEEADEDEKEN